MIFNRQYRVYSDLLFLSDVVSVVLALSLSYHLRYYLVLILPLQLSRFFNPELLAFRDYLFYFLLFSPLWVVLLLLTQRYSRLVRLPLRLQLLRVFQFMLVIGFLMGFLTYSFKLEVSRPIFFVFLAVVGVSMSTMRLLLHGVLRSRNINEHNQIKILIAASDKRAQAVGEWLERYEMWGYHVVGYLARDKSERKVPGLNVLGTLDELPGRLQKKIVADEIIFLGLQRPDLAEFEEMVRLCEDLGVRVRIAADFLPSKTSRISLEFLENLPLLTFSTVPDHSVSIVAKRVLDFVVAALILILCLPLMLLSALLIKFTSPGPVFYRQVRCGLYGRRFRLVKFRTMVEGAEDRLWEIRHLNEMEGPVFKMRNDPRVTPLGRYLRKFSIDELPQIWNVIKGEMSIVGPRAPLPEEVEHYSVKQRRRLSVKPGITCLWQISGRNDIDFNQWMELDLHYIDNWSFWLDVRIMLRTIPAVFTGRGAR